MRFSHTLSTCKHYYVYSTIIVLAMTLFLAGCPSPNGSAPNDSKPLLTITATQASVTEGGTSTFTITRNNVEGRLEVSFTLSGSAEHNVDYTVDGQVFTQSLQSTLHNVDYAVDSTVNTDSTTGDKTMTVVFVDSNKSVDIPIIAVNDEVPDNGEEVVITINESDDYTIGDPYTATLTIVDPAPSDVPVVSISTSGENNINEDESISVTITSNQQVPNGLEVILTIGGDATINEDYALPGVTTTTSGGTVTATVTIPSGNTETMLTIDATNDSIREVDENLTITISDEPSTYRIKEGEKTVTVTITDDDRPTVSIAVDRDEISESSADGEVEVTLTRSQDEVRDSLTVQLKIEGGAENGKDYETLPNTVIFNKGEDTATITLTAKDDDIHELAETVVITIIDEPSRYRIKEDEETVTVTINDDDLPTVGFRTASQRLDEGNAESIIITLERTGDTSEALEVELSTSGNASEREDYTLITTHITIPRTKASVDFTLQLHDDGDVEGNEEVIITIIEMASMYTIDEENRMVTITIVDDDDTDGDMIPNSEDVDDDNDGLIEIHNLEMLRNVHFNLAGTSYDDEEDDVGTGDPGDTNGGPDSQTDHCKTRVNKVFLCGYELMRDLNFNDAKSYVAESIHPPWQPDGGNHQTATNEGFPGIGAETGDSGGFTGIFEGNGHSISNLYMRNTTDADRYNTGLFRRTEAGAKIRNLGMMNVSIYGGDGDYDRVGGLVGYNYGTITASYATGDVDGGAGNFDSVGGLVGLNYGIITASYASGTVDGGDGDSDNVGGLVGYNLFGTITASYASGTVDGGDGNLDLVGGLVGSNVYATITASYATGTVDGGAGDSDEVGGLVGKNDESRITASYATGTVNGGAGTDDAVGGLVGYNNRGTITASYGFGTTVGSDGSDGDPKPTLTSGTSITMASELSHPGSAANETTAPAGSSWNSAGRNTLGVWDFGNSDQNPALKYADYDASGSAYSCNQFPATIPGTDTPLVCGTTLLPGQR